MTRTRKPAGEVVVVTTVLVALLATVSAVATPASVSARGPSTAEPGQGVTFSFSLTNTGENASAYILDIPVPTGWTVTNHSDDGGTWKDSDPSWLWQTVDAGESVSPSVTVRVPDDARGDYTLSVMGKDSDGVVGADFVNVSVEGESPVSVPTETRSPTIPAGDEEPQVPTDTPAADSSSEGVPGFSPAAALAGFGAAIVALGRKVLDVEQVGGQ